jgi:kinetochore protein Nuf2
MSMAPRTTSHGAHNQRAPAPQENDAFMTLVCAFQILDAQR